MKKYMIMLVSLLLVIGCGGNASTQDNASFSIEINGKQVTLNQAFNVADYGDYIEYFEQASCGYEGMDQIIAYSNATIYTYPDAEGVDRILEIELSANGVTLDNLSFASTLEDIVKLYGNDYSNYGDVYRFKDGKNVLSVTIVSGSIIGFSYIYEA